MAVASKLIGTNVTLFFTMGACQALARKTTSLPGWSEVPIEGTSLLAVDYDQNLKRNKVARFEELITSCASLEVRFIVCEMGLRALNLQHGSLRDDVSIEEGGVVTFINDGSKDGSIIFI